MTQRATPRAVLRPGRDADAAEFIALVSGAWAEYPGCVFDLDGEVPELRALATHVAGHGGALWAAEAEGRVVGMVSVTPLDPAAWRIGRMYVAPAHRGSGLAQALLGAAEAHARASGGARAKLWSDTKFDRAHRFYERAGYVRHGPLAVLHDRSNTIEFGYAKPLAGIVTAELDAAASASAVRALGGILRDCVDAGASISFLAPLPLEEAFAYMRTVAKAVACGERRLLVAWAEGIVVGSVVLDLDTPPNQRHRAEVKKMIVSPAARRLGVGRALMLAVEQVAVAAGRSLLTLDTRVGDPGEALYRALGWHEAGRIPGYTRDAQGQAFDTVAFYKAIPPTRGERLDRA